MKKIIKVLLPILAAVSLCSCDVIKSGGGFEKCTKVHIPEVGCVEKDKCEICKGSYQALIKYTDKDGNIIYTDAFMFVVDKCPICDKKGK